MIVKTLLAAKSGPVACVDPDVTILSAVERLTALQIGALVVTDDAGAVVGVFSERDLVRGLAEDGGDILERRVSDLMTRRVETVSLQDTVDRLMSLMTNRRVRHLPVIDRGKLVGIVSIGDVVKHKIAEAEEEAQALRAYIAS